MARRKPLSKRLRFEVFKRDLFRCRYCGRSAPEVALSVDHIEPVSKGGTDDLLNLVTSCFDCNSGKSNRKLSDEPLAHIQTQQLRELAARQEQARMMLEWRRKLAEEKQVLVNFLRDRWAELFHPYHLNEGAISDLGRLVERFGFNQVAESIETAAAVYRRCDEHGATTDSFNRAFNKLGGICFNRENGISPQRRR